MKHSLEISKTMNQNTTTLLPSSPEKTINACHAETIKTIPLITPLYPGPYDLLEVTHYKFRPRELSCNSTKKGGTAIIKTS